MTSIGAVALAEVLPEIHGLEYLDLSSNAICDSGAAAIAKAIINYSGFTSDVCTRYFSKTISHTYSKYISTNHVL